MSSTSKKHGNFVSEPMRNKSVDQLPGVGRTISDRMRNDGLNNATGVLAKYLTLDQDQRSFQTWMKDSYGANAKQSGDCYRALNDWSNEFL